MRAAILCLSLVSTAATAAVSAATQAEFERTTSRALNVIAKHTPDVESLRVVWVLGFPESQEVCVKYRARNAANGYEFRHFALNLRTSEAINEDTPGFMDVWMKVCGSEHEHLNLTAQARSYLPDIVAKSQ